MPKKTPAKKPQKGAKKAKIAPVLEPVAPVQREIATVPAEPVEDAPPPVPDEWREAVDGVLKLLVLGGRDADVLSFLADEWAELPALEVVAFALQTVRDAADIDPELVRGWAFLATKDVFRAARGTADFGTALRAIKQLLDLAGE